MRFSISIAAIVPSLLLFMTGAASAELVDWHVPGDNPYLSFDDSPWVETSEDLDYFWLEDFENGALDTPGLSASAGLVRAPGGATDSVDGDDGLIDGWGRDGWSYKEYNPDGASITFSFDVAMLGVLPTYAGLVWTDGNGAADVFFEAFDAFGESIGFSQALVGDGIHNGSTAADRFFGVEFSGGISAITISAEFGSLEVDHIQYGANYVPAPSAAALILAGLAGARRRRRTA